MPRGKNPRGSRVERIHSSNWQAARRAPCAPWKESTRLQSRKNPLQLHTCAGNLQPGARRVSQILLFKSLCSLIYKLSLSVYEAHLQIPAALRSLDDELDESQETSRNLQSWPRTRLCRKPGSFVAARHPSALH